MCLTLLGIAGMQACSPVRPARPDPVVMADEVAQGKRLIELPSGETRWLTIGEVIALSQEGHARGQCPGFRDITPAPSRLAAMIEGDEEEIEEDEDKMAIEAVAEGEPITVAVALSGREPRRMTLVNVLALKIDPSRMMKVVKELSAFPNRSAFDRNGRKAMASIEARFRAAARASGRADIEIRTLEHDYCAAYLPEIRQYLAENDARKRLRKKPGATVKPSPGDYLSAEASLDCQPSLIVRIPGRGEKAAQKVILGAHGDSVTTEYDPRVAAPGADDNASGVAALLEAFSLVAGSGIAPERTLEFIVYAGEEWGLLGSGEIAASYRGQDVVGVLQLDMTMHPSETKEVAFMSDFSDSFLVGFSKRLFAEYVGGPVVDDKCAYACSDHASWYKSGFPSTFAFEAPFQTQKFNPRIHTDLDLAEFLDAEHGAKFAKLALAFALELAEDGPAAASSPLPSEAPAQPAEPAVP